MLYLQYCTALQPLPFCILAFFPLHITSLSNQPRCLPQCDAFPTASTMISSPAITSLLLCSFMRGRLLASPSSLGGVIQTFLHHTPHVHVFVNVKPSISVFMHVKSYCCIRANDGRSLLYGKENVSQR